MSEIAGTAERGDQVAWSVPPHNHRSAVHRAFSATHTFCSRAIPHDRRIGLPLGKQHKCSRCERMYKRSLQYRDTTPEASLSA